MTNMSNEVQNNASCQIGVSGSAFSIHDLKCGNIQPINRIEKIKLYENGDCYDQHDNYLGKGKFVDGVLQVERANYL